MQSAIEDLGHVKGVIASRHLSGDLAREECPSLGELRHTERVLDDFVIPERFGIVAAGKRFQQPVVLLAKNMQTKQPIAL